MRKWGRFILALRPTDGSVSRRGIGVSRNAASGAKEGTQGGKGQSKTTGECICPDFNVPDVRVCVLEVF